MRETESKGKMRERQKAKAKWGRDRKQRQNEGETESKEREDRHAAPAHSCGHERCCGRWGRVPPTAPSGPAPRDAPSCCASRASSATPALPPAPPPWPAANIAHKKMISIIIHQHFYSPVSLNKHCHGGFFFKQHTFFTIKLDSELSLETKFNKKQVRPWLEERSGWKSPKSALAWTGRPAVCILTSLSVHHMTSLPRPHDQPAQTSWPAGNSNLKTLQGL